MMIYSWKVKQRKQTYSQRNTQPDRTARTAREVSPVTSEYGGEKTALVSRGLRSLGAATEDNRGGDRGTHARTDTRTRAQTPTTRALTRTRYTAQAGAPVLPLAASQGEGGRRQPPPPSAGPNQRCSTHHPRAHAHTTHGTGRSAGATPRRLTRRGRPTPTAAAVHRAEAGARRPGLPAPTTSVHTTPPLYPPAYHTSPTGKRSSRGGRRAKWGEVKRVRGAAIGVAASWDGARGTCRTPDGGESA